MFSRHCFSRIGLLLASLAHIVSGQTTRDENPTTTASLAETMTAPQWEAKTGDDINPSPEELLRRGSNAAAVIGDFIYFDNAMVSQNDSNAQYFNFLNTTWAIDLRESWDTKDVELIEIDFGNDSKQSGSDAAIMVDKSQGSFYTWGGANAVVIEPNLWRFDPNGKGSGEWVDVTPNNSSDTFFKLQRSSLASVASTDDAAFIFGGQVDSRTETEPEKNGEIGYRIFNFTTQEWNEVTNMPSSYGQTVYAGSAVFAPDFGPNGFIFMLGGLRNNTNSNSGLDFRTLHMMDPVSQTWYEQKTTGRAPGSRFSLCSAGVSTADGRFDIFMFGGSTHENTDADGDNVWTSFGDVWVLSLPGFHWTLATVSREAEDQRAFPVCSVVGQRQLLSLGGHRLFTDDTNKGWSEKDPWPQAVGIYDMTTWMWQDRYDAGAKPYEQHPELRAWYDQGGLDKVEWSDALKVFFNPSDDDVEESDKSPNGGAKSDSESDSDADSDSDGGGGSASKAGIIAGSTVGGIALIAGLVAAFFFWRIRQRRKARTTTTAASAQMSELGSDHTKSASPAVPYHHGSGYYNPPMRDLSASYMPAQNGYQHSNLGLAPTQEGNQQGDYGYQQSNDGYPQPNMGCQQANMGYQKPDGRGYTEIHEMGG